MAHPAAGRIRRPAVLEDRNVKTANRFLKLATLTFCFALLAIMTAPAQAHESDALGVWATEPTERGQAHVKITKEGDVYVGEIIWLEKPTYDASEGADLEGKEKTDRQNPDASKRDQPIVGLQIVNGMKYSGEHAWEGGTIYDPENGKTYKAKMSLEGDTLKVRGFIGFSLLGRTSEWTRVKDAEEAKEEGTHEHEGHEHE